MSRNDCKYEGLKTQTGLDTSINDMFLVYLQNNGATSDNLNDAQLEFLAGQGQTSGSLNDKWFAFLGNLGLTGALADRLQQFWCDIGGALGPTAIIKQSAGCSCIYDAPDTDCENNCTYVGSGVSFTNPPDTWLWAVTNGTLISGQGTDTIVVQTISGSNVPVTVDLTATDSVSTDSDQSVRVFTQAHNSVTTAPVWIGPDLVSQSFPQGSSVVDHGVAGRFSGYVSLYTLEGNWPAGVTIDPDTGLIGGVWGNSPADEGVYSNLSVGASNSVGTGYSNSETATITEAEVDAPNFLALNTVPDVEIGFGNLTTTHTSTLYTKVGGVYTAFGTDVPVWDGSYLQYYPAATNEMLNSGVVGTETITVTAGTWSINCLVNGTDIASCIVTAGTATATGYGTATPGNLIELDVTVGGTITIENTGDIFCCNLTNSDISTSRGLGPIITTTAAVSTDITKYEFDIVNDNNQNSVWFFEVNESIVIDTSACMNTGTTSNPFQFLAGDDTIARSSPDGTLSRDRTTVRGIDVTNKVAGIFSVIDSKTVLNINGVYANEVSGYDIGYSSLDFITVGVSSAGGFPPGAVKYRNLRRYDIASYQDGRALIDGLMS